MTMTSPSEETQPFRGIFCMVAGLGLLTLNDAIIKWYSADYPIGQMMAVRGAFMFLPIAILVWKFGGWETVRVRDWRTQILRGILMVLGIFTFLASLSIMPIADAVAFSFVGPLFVTALAVPMLGEHVGVRRWSAIIVGFVGVVIMIRPSPDAFRVLALLPITAAFFGAFRDIYTRQMHATETSNSILICTNVIIIIAGLLSYPVMNFGIAADWMALIGLGTPLPWKALDQGALIAFAGAGFLSGFANYLMIEAFRFGEAGTVSPFKYFTLIWAIVVGFAVWGDLPDLWTVFGALIVIASGLYILHREQQRKAVSSNQEAQRE